MALLAVEGLRTLFDTAGGAVTAVDDVSLSLGAGEVLGLVGESGSGKSVTAFSLLGLLPHPGRVAAGSARFDGAELLGADARTLRRIRGRRISMIFQEPLSSLNPVYTVGRQVAEPLRLHFGLSAAEAGARALAMLRRVGIPDAEARFATYPHQLSGGLRQRVMIAIALVCRPEILIADEPTTALDVTVQAQILALLRDLQAEFGMAVMLITHDLGVIADMADRVAVMYAGRVVETAPVGAIFARPRHPYTAALVAGMPDHTRSRRRLPTIEGAVPAPGAMPPGCRFAPRCRHALPECAASDPRLAAIGPGHATACLRRDDPALADLLAILEAEAAR